MNRRWLQGALQDDAYIRWVTGVQIWERMLAALTRLVAAEPVGLMVASHPHLVPTLGTGWEVWVVDADPAPLALLQQPAVYGLQGDETGRFALCLLPGLGLLLVSDEERLGLGWHPFTLNRAIAALRVHVRLPEALSQRLHRAVAEPPDPAKLSDWWAALAVTPAPELVLPPLAETEMVCTLAHEVKTPLATIQTLAHSLLQRAELPPVVRQRLESIEAECREQIERFAVIFAAACPLPAALPLSPLSLGELLASLWPEWVSRGQRRAVSLSLDVPPDLPPCVSHAERLQALLGGVLDRLIRSLPPDSTVILQVREAGAYLKLQFRVQRAGAAAWMQAVGQWLVWQPETGTVALSLAAANALLQSLGARLSMRLASAPQDDEVLVVFLPRFLPTAAIG